MKPRLSVLLVCLAAGTLACGGRIVEREVPTVTVQPQSPDATQEPETSAEPTATLTPVPLESLVIPEIASTTVETVYPQAQRATLGGFDTFFWPDGNIGFVPVGDEYLFFAANSSYTMRTRGTLENPAAVVETNRLAVAGASDEFDYLAGGPVYRDLGTGMLILFYHAEGHLGSAISFHSALGLAASTDEGQTFQNLGIIIEPEAAPDPSAPCCTDVGGATFTIKDGMFYLYYRERLADLTDIQLALATAPVNDVVEAAHNGTTSEWHKYDGSFTQLGIGGEIVPLEIGNPQANWFSVSYNTTLDRFIMAISRSGYSNDPSWLYLIASEDGIHWSPRVELTSCQCELTYPSIINPEGDPVTTAETFYIYYVTTPLGVTRWHNMAVERMTVTLTGAAVEAPHEWEFDADPEGWKPLFDMASFEVQDGVLVIEASGTDPYMESPSLGLSTERYTTIEVRMRLSAGYTGQFFFTSTDSSGFSESSSVRFPVRGSGDFEIYTVKMAGAPGWSGHMGVLRFDPTEQQGLIEIDYIRLVK